jgi:hypothetical protein
MTANAIYNNTGRSIAVSTHVSRHRARFRIYQNSPVLKSIFSILLVSKPVSSA